MLLHLLQSPFDCSNVRVNDCSILFIHHYIRLMQALGFYILLPFPYFISLLPSFILYLIADVLYYFIYYIFGYRKKAVRMNLKNSFPEKNDQERKEIEKKFYRHFSDLLIESAKALTISKKEIKKRRSFKKGSMEIFTRLHAEGKHCIALMGHYGDWETAGLSMSFQSPYLLKVIYRRLSNPYFNRLIYRLRNRFGALPLEMNEAPKELMKRALPLACTVFIADQTPPPDSALWLNFLNQDTPFFQGAEKLSRRLNYPVVFASVKKVQRGYYEITIELLCENPSTTSEGEITSLFAKKLEEDIIAQPEIWLWSHRRWKHKREHRTL